MIDQAVLIATGRGLRLGPVITDRPKAMMPVLGKPIIVRVMDRLREAGIRRFVVVVGEQEGEAAAYLKRSWVPDVKIEIVLQSAPRGNADALLCAAGYVDNTFILTASDHLAPMSHVPALLKRFQESRCDMALSVTATPESTTRLPIVTADGLRVASIQEYKGQRSRHALSGFMLHACRKRILNYVERGQGNDREFVSVIARWLNAGAKMSYVTAEWHAQLNTEIDLLTVNKRLLREGRDAHILSEVPSSVYITPPVRIDPLVTIGRGAKIGPNVYLESGAQVGPNAIIWDSVILRNAVIPDGEVLHGQIVTRQARISEPQQAEVPSENTYTDSTIPPS